MGSFCFWISVCAGQSGCCGTARLTQHVVTRHKCLIPRSSAGSFPLTNSKQEGWREESWAWLHFCGCFIVKCIPWEQHVSRKPHSASHRMYHLSCITRPATQSFRNGSQTRDELWLLWASAPHLCLLFVPLSVWLSVSLILAGSAAMFETGSSLSWVETSLPLAPTPNSLPPLKQKKHTLFIVRGYEPIQLAKFDTGMKEACVRVG